MRYACPNCKRVFYLETKVQSPCPACGTMLQVGEGEGASGEAGAPPAPGAEEATTGGSWLMDEADAGPFGGPPALSPEKAAITQPASPPQPPQAVPSPTSWVESGGQALAPPGARPRPPAAPPAQGAVERLKAATGPMPAAQAPPSHLRMPTAAYPPAKQAPSGMKVLMVTAATILIALAVATAVLVLLPKDKPPADGSPLVPKGSHAEIAGLKITIDELREEMSTYKDGLDAEKAGRKEIEEELAGVRQEADSLKVNLDRRGEAARKTLAAQELLERHVELDRAMDLTVDALKIDSHFVPAHRLRGRILAAMGRPDGAFGAFENADESALGLGGAGDIEALVLAGELALTVLGDREKAAAYYGRATDLNADSALGLAAGARLLMLDGNLTRAEAKAVAAQEKAPSLALARLVRGEIAFERSLGKSGAERGKLRQEADEHLAEALRLDPDSVRACVVRGKVLIEEASFASAQSDFGLRRLHKQSQAERLLSKALELSPDLPEAHVAIAELLLADGALRDPAVAKTRANAAVRLTGGKDASAIAALAAAQSASGDPVAAEKTMEKAVELEPKNTGYRERHARYRTEAKALRLKR